MERRDGNSIKCSWRASSASSSCFTELAGPRDEMCNTATSGRDRNVRPRCRTCARTDQQRRERYQPVRHLRDLQVPLTLRIAPGDTERL